MSFLRFRKAPKRATDTTPLAQLFEALEEPLLAYAFRITASVEMAQDIVQDAFIKLHQASTPIESPKAWLYRTVHNHAINLSKRRSRERPLEAATTAAAPYLAGLADDELPSAELERNELVGLARLMVEQLEEPARQVVALKFQEGLAYKQIAERTGLSVSNVGYILHHAVKSLADEFQRLGVKP